jgi:hypothetical protein
MSVKWCGIRSALLLAAAVPVAAGTQTTSGHSWPVPPRSLGEAAEVALALSAAPAEVSANADVYVLRNAKYVKVRTGTNGCACLVGRDYHEGSRYPICFDQVASTTWLQREITAGELRAAGVPEDEVQRRIDAAEAAGELSWPSRPGVAYMMSRHQVLFSSPGRDGVRVGAWWPHLMLILPGVTSAQLGLAAESKVRELQLQPRGDQHAELIVKLPAWSDGTPVGSTAK